MRNILIIGFVLASMMILAGCGAGNEVGPSRTPFVGGANGLVMSFVEGAPPAEVFDDGQFPFSINVRIENLGEHDVEPSDGYIEITGIEAQEFNKQPGDLRQDIPYRIGKVTKTPQGTIIIGDTIIAEFNELNFMRNIRGNWDGARIRANLCYNYETEATTAVCLKRDMLTNIDTREICSLSGQKQVFNSGAPIQVTKVTQAPLGSDKIQVQFEVSHVGSQHDRFYKLDTDCDDRTTNLDKNKVYINVETDINGNYAQCSGLEGGQSGSNEGFITLHGGSPRIVICTYEVGEISGAFERQINVKLGYRYYQFIERNLLIKDVSPN